MFWGAQAAGDYRLAACAPQSLASRTAVHNLV
jgi:hypothetical protein